MEEIKKDELDKMIEDLLNELGYNEEDDYQDAIDSEMEAEIKYFVH